MTLKNNELLPFLMDHLPPSFAKKATRELNETSERKASELLNLKQLTKDDDTLCEIDFADDFLIQFLRHAKYNTPKAFFFLKNLIKFKRNYNYLMKSIPEQYFSEKPSTKFGTVLPSRCPDGCAIIYLQIGLWDPAELSFDDFKRVILILFVQSLYDPMTQINGFKLIYDFEGTSFRHLRYCTPRLVRFQYHTALECVPARYKAIHFVNESIVLSTGWSLFKRFISTKLRNRVFFHSNGESLLNHFPRSMVPVKYGGDLTDYYQEDLVKKLNREYGSCPMGGQNNYY